MKSGWGLATFGEMFELDLDAVIVDTSVSYQMAGVLSYGRGLFNKTSVSGADTSYKTFYRLHEGQIVLSQLFGWEGALAPVTSDFNGWFVSSQFPTFRPKINLHGGFARWLIRNPTVWEQLKTSAKGMGDRRRTLNPEIFFGVTLPVPPLAEQERIVAHLDAIETRLARIQKLREKMYCEIEAFNTSLHLSLANNRNVRLEQLIQLEEEQVSVVANQSYLQAGIRSFGLGLFKKAAVSGSETTYRTFNVLRPGMLVMSQVKGWEGAVSVVGDVFDGWFVSPEYRTFSCNDNECEANYLTHIVGTTWFRNQLSAATRGVGARRERVRPEVLLGLEMPFPKFSDQIKAVGLLEKITSSKKISLQAVEKETSIIPSLLDKIFGQ